MGKILVQECYLNGCPHLAIFEIPDAVESDNLVKKKVRCRVQDLGKGVKKYKLDQNGLERSAILSGQYDILHLITPRIFLQLQFDFA